MQLEHSFTVPAGLEQAWQLLLDIERVAPCLPGACLETVDGDEFSGTVKVRLGPIGLTYRGMARFVEKDEAAHRVVLDAQGREVQGNGTASARIIATLVADGEQSSSVTVLTDLNITGEPARSGRGVLAAVGNTLIDQFAECLAVKLAGTDAAPLPEAEAAPGSAAAARSTLDQPTPAAAEIAAGVQATADSTAPGTDPLAPTFTEPEPGGAAAATSEPAPAEPARLVTSGVERSNPLGSAGPAVAKRLATITAAVLVAVLLAIRRRR